MNIAQFFRILWARKWIVVISTVACFLAGVLAVMLLPRQYTASASVLLNITSADPSGGPNDAVGYFAKNYLPSQTNIVESYSVARRTAQNLGWDRSPQVRANYADYQSNNGAQANDFDHWMAGQISRNVSGKEVQGTNIIQIDYTSPDAEDAARMANAVRQAYIDEDLAGKRESANDAAVWFERQMRDVSRQREAAEQRLVNYERGNGIIMLNDTNDAESARLQALAGITPNLGSQVIGGGGGVSPNAAQIAALDAKISTESAALGPNHPTILDLKRQRAALASLTGGVVAPKVIVGPSIDSVVSATGQKVIGQRNKVEEARRLASDVSVLREQYTKMATRAADLRQQGLRTETTMAPLDNAVPPKRPAFPKVPLVLAGSLGLGLVAGLLLAMIVEFMRRRVRGIDDLSATKVPLIGVINAPPSGLLAAA